MMMTVQSAVLWWQAQGELTRDEDKRLVGRFAREYLRHDGVFALRVVAHNSSTIIIQDLVLYLWRIYRGKEHLHNSQAHDSHGDGHRAEVVVWPVSARCLLNNRSVHCTVHSNGRYCCLAGPHMPTVGRLWALTDVSLPVTLHVWWLYVLRKAIRLKVKGWSKSTWNRLLELDCMKVGLCTEDALCWSKWIVGFNHIGFKALVSFSLI